MILKNAHKIQLKALTTILLGLFFFGSALGQEKSKINIHLADKQVYKKVGENDIFWLTGNVEYEHQGAIMQCDSSIYYRSENRFNAYGNVRINQGDTLMMTGDQMTYDGTSKILHITGNVFLSERKMRLSCKEIIYDRNINLAYYNTGGVLTQEDNRLSSVKGFYNATTKRFIFQQNVHLVNPEYEIIADTLEYASDSKIAYFLGPTEILADSTRIYCERGQYDTERDIAQLTQNAVITKKAQTIKGDNIYYEVKRGYGDITGNAFISDTVNNYVITGGRAKYREKPEYALVTDHPLYALNIDDDTLFITGDTLHVQTDADAKRKLRVYHNTKFYKRDFQGKCDSLLYAESDSTFYLYHDPVVWNEQNQLTADFIFMTTKSGDLDSLHMIGNAFLIAREDSIKYNQIKGRDMFGKFYSNELRTIFVEGNGQTVYYAYDEQEKEIGVNRADCSNLMIRIAESQVQRITFLTKPNATLYPPGQIPKGELFLKGFKQRFDEQLKGKADLLAP